MVDDTHARRADRLALVALARTPGLRPVIYWFPPDVRASLARNAARAGRARVPPVAIHATRQRLVGPDPAEGFERVFEVAATAEGGFLGKARPELAARGPA